MPQLSAPTPDATTTSKGKIQLAGGLGGTAASPTLVASGLTGTVPTANLGSGTASSKTFLTGAQTYIFRPIINVSETGSTAPLNTTTPTSLFTSPYTFAAGELNTGDVIIVKCFGGWLNNSGGNSTLVVTPFLGVNSTNAFTTGSTATSATAHSTIIDMHYRIVNATTAQVSYSVLISAPTLGSSLTAANSAAMVPNTLTIANIATLTNILDVQLSFGNAGTSTQSWTPRSNFVQHIYNN